MKRKIITIVVSLVFIVWIGIVLANNKAKIDKAAKPVKNEAVVPVKAIEAQEDSFNTAFSITGSTTPEREVQIASEVQGKPVRLSIENGDIVRAGQTIATLDASVYSVQLSSIEANIAKAKLDIERYERLLTLGGATALQVETATLQFKGFVAEKRALLEQISHMQIRAPFSGKIENLKVETGSYVTFGTVLANLLDNSSLKINVYLSEQEAFKVKLGQKVTISSAVLSKPKTGKVSVISDKADASGKFLAEITFSNTDKEKLKAGILADVLFPMETTDRGLSIPVSALIGSANDAKIFVVKDNRAELRKIKTGIVTTTKVEVIEGLKAGEQVIISGQLNLENGTAISINK